MTRNYSQLGVAPDLMIAYLLVKLAECNRAEFMTFQKGRPLQELASFLRPEDQSRHADYLDRLEDPDYIWVLVEWLGGEREDCADGSKEEESE